MSDLRQELTIVDSDLARLMRLDVACRASFEPTAVHDPEPLSKAAEVARPACCMIVRIAPNDSIVDVQRLVERVEPASVLFLAESLPLSHSISRVIHRAGHGVISAHERPVVVATTLIALLAQPAAP